MKTASTVLLALLIAAATACGGDNPGAPSSGTTTPTPAATQLAVFTDPVTMLMTSDVRDADEQIVRFDVANNTLIWAADGRAFNGYVVSAAFINASFQVRFGTSNGERRAYFTERVPATICDIQVNFGVLSILPTSKTVPGGG